MKRLIVFDVDGTLTLTNEVHGRLFPLAIEEVLGIDGIARLTQTFERSPQAPYLEN